MRFCERYVDRRSRTHDQMVQAARSGRQNLAEGSVDSGTSKKLEMKLTGVAKGSLEELQLDYEDYLRQRGLPKWAPEHPALVRFRARRCATVAEFRAWVNEERQAARQDPADGQRHADGQDTAPHGRARTGGAASGGVRAGPCQSVSVGAPSGEAMSARVLSPRRPLPSAAIAANGVLSLLNLCIYLIGRQVEAQAAAFEREGGFTKRLHRRRRERRQRGRDGA